MRKNTNSLVLFLFVVYIALLVWIILFKLGATDTVRSLNLIPFYYENGIGTRFHLKEVMENILIFVPLGIYLCMLNYKPSFIIKLSIIFAMTFALELFQYVLAVGRTDITDIITNTCGGIIGIGIYWTAAKILHGEEQANKIITVVAAITTVVVVGGISLLLILN